METEDLGIMVASLRAVDTADRRYSVRYQASMEEGLSYPENEEGLLLQPRAPEGILDVGRREWYQAVEIRGGKILENR